MNRSGRASTNMTQCQKWWQGQHFVSCLISGGGFAKIILFELYKLMPSKRTIRRKS